MSSRRLADLPRPRLDSLSCTDRQVLDLLTDPAALSELVQTPVRADRLRFKPGSISTVGLDRGSADRFDALGWLRVGGRHMAVKAENARRKAAQRGLTVTVRHSGDLIAFHGPLAADPRLVKPLVALDGVDQGVDQVLRYNPLRRVVLRMNGDVVRLTAAPHRTTAQLADWLAGRIPALGPNWIDRRGQVSWWPWFGTSNLIDQPARLADAVARRSGAALADLHRVSGLPIDLARLNPGKVLRSHTAELCWAGGDLMDRAAVLSARLMTALRGLPPRPDTVLHGDFSGDQVFVDESGEVRLADFDRATIGPAGVDVGSFAAVELLVGRVRPRQWRDGALLGPLMTGYAEEDRLPTDAEIAAWAAFGLFQRIWQPLRGLDPRWREAMSARLDLIEELL